MRRNIMYTLLIIMSALILVGTGVVGYTLYHAETRDPAKLYFENGLALVEFRELALHPGESVEYNIDVLGEPEGKCTITFDFQEVENENGSNDLKNYVYARVEFEGQVMCDMLLADLLKAELPTVGCALDKKEPLDLKITYYMPLEVGNEAKGTEALFNLVANVSYENK